MLLFYMKCGMAVASTWLLFIFSVVLAWRLEGGSETSFATIFVPLWIIVGFGYIFASLKLFYALNGGVHGTTWSDVWLLWLRLLSVTFFLALLVQKLDGRLGVLRWSHVFTPLFVNFTLSFVWSQFKRCRGWAKKGDSNFGISFFVVAFYGLLVARLESTTWSWWLVFLPLFLVLMVMLALVIGSTVALVLSCCDFGVNSEFHDSQLFIGITSSTLCVFLIPLTALLLCLVSYMDGSATVSLSSVFLAFYFVEVLLIVAVGVAVTFLVRSVWADPGLLQEWERTEVRPHYSHRSLRGGHQWITSHGSRRAKGRITTILGGGGGGGGGGGSCCCPLNSLCFCCYCRGGGGRGGDGSFFMELGGFDNDDDDDDDYDSHPQPEFDDDDDDDDDQGEFALRNGLNEHVVAFEGGQQSEGVLRSQRNRTKQGGVDKGGLEEGEGGRRRQRGEGRGKTGLLKYRSGSGSEGLFLGRGGGGGTFDDVYENESRKGQMSGKADENNGGQDNDYNHNDDDDDDDDDGDGDGHDDPVDEDNERLLPSSESPQGAGSGWLPFAQAFGGFGGGTGRRSTRGRERDHSWRDDTGTRKGDLEGGGGRSSSRRRKGTETNKEEELRLMSMGLLERPDWTSTTSDEVGLDGESRVEDGVGRKKDGASASYSGVPLTTVDDWDEAEEEKNHARDGGSGAVLFDFHEGSRLEQRRRRRRRRSPIPETASHWHRERLQADGDGQGGGQEGGGRGRERGRGRGRGGERGGEEGSPQDSANQDEGGGGLGALGVRPALWSWLDRSSSTHRGRRPQPAKLSRLPKAKLKY